MNAELRKNHERIMSEFRSLGIRPKMELIRGNGRCVPDSFDLRTLNKNIVKRSNIVYPSE